MESTFKKWQEDTEHTIALMDLDKALLKPKLVTPTPTRFPPAKAKFDKWKRAWCLSLG